jgi:uncharacterized protein YbcI
LTEQAPQLEDKRQQIAVEIANVHEDSYGVAVTDVVVMLEDDHVAVMMDGDLTRGEQTLVDAGNEDVVIHGREAFQQAIATTYAAVVERATGRRVESFASRTVVRDDRVWAIEAFRLSRA